MPKVTLIDFTGKGRPDETWHAADLLLFTKGTRLTMSPTGFDDIAGMLMMDKWVALEEMAQTIPSSWEFVDVVFLLEGVTRACAQQITRTRTASYAMQSQRIADLKDVPVTNPFDTNEQDKLNGMFEAYAQIAVDAYGDLIEYGAAPQDARGLLPMNTQCNLVAKYNLRAFVDLVHSRSSLRTQSEYADIVRDMVGAVHQAWPWSSIFLQRPEDIAFKTLEDLAQELGVVPGNGPGWRLAKVIDLLRRAK
jgi:flavin-dependent thymidylate synthase